MNLNYQSRSDVPFAQYLLIESENSTALQAAVSKEIAQHDFSFLNDDEHRSATINCVRLNKTVHFGVCFGADVHASTEPINALQLVAPLKGNLVSRTRGETSIAKPGEALLLKPDDPVDLDWQSSTVAIVTWIDQQFLGEMAITLFGQIPDGQLSFPSQLTLKKGVGLSVSNALGAIVSEVDDEDSLFSRGVTTHKIEDVLLTALLYASDDVNDMVRKTRLDGKSSVQTALEYIYENIEEDISASDLAVATGVSLRKLQYDFSNQLGIGPMSKIRQEKLRRARNYLLKADPDTSTVADIAAIWGFFDRRYFTKVYKNEFGECTSVTLNRAD